MNLSRSAALVATCDAWCWHSWRPLSSSGCTLFKGINEYVAYNESCDEFVLDWRNHVWSWQAWRARMHQFGGQPQFYSFGEGFRDGYQEVATGGDGCPPAIAPRRFWSYNYQSPEGQAKVAAWFAGYPYGVQAAREDGAAGFQRHPDLGYDRRDVLIRLRRRQLPHLPADSLGSRRRCDTRARGRGRASHDAATQLDHRPADSA